MSKKAALFCAVGTLFSICLTVYAGATVLTGIPRWSDLQRVEGRLERVGEECLTRRYGDCQGSYVLTLEGDRRMYRMPNRDAAQLPATGQRVSLMVRPDPESREFTGWAAWDIWELKQEGQVLVSYSDMVGRALPAQIVWFLCGVLIGGYLTAALGWPLVGEAIKKLRRRRPRRRKSAEPATGSSGS